MGYSLPPTMSHADSRGSILGAPPSKEESRASMACFPPQTSSRPAFRSQGTAGSLFGEGPATPLGHGMLTRQPTAGLLGDAPPTADTGNRRLGRSMTGNLSMDKSVGILGEGPPSSGGNSVSHSPSRGDSVFSMVQASHARRMSESPSRVAFDDHSPAPPANRLQRASTTHNLGAIRSSSITGLPHSASAKKISFNGLRQESPERRLSFGVQREITPMPKTQMLHRSYSGRVGSPALALPYTQNSLPGISEVDVGMPVIRRVSRNSAESYSSGSEYQRSGPLGPDAVGVGFLRRRYAMPPPLPTYVSLTA